MMPSMPRGSAHIALAGTVLAAAFSAAAQTGHFYADILPDTLQPGETYTFGSPVIGPLKIAANGPARWPDTVDLKRGSTFIRMIGTVPAGGSAANYSLNVPWNATVGSYAAYSPQATLLESDVAMVPDIGSLTPRLIVTGLRGLRGERYTYTVRAIGLAFGPPPGPEAYAPSIRYAAFELGTDTIPFNDIRSGTPYVLSGTLSIPGDAAEGNYRLVVERGDGVTTIAENALTVWVPPRPTVLDAEPDSLVAGESGTIGISGLNLDYAVMQGSFVQLDRNMVREVHLRHGDIHLAATQYPSLGTDFYVKAQIRAGFELPASFPAGRYDLGVVLAGRPDTAFLTDGVRVVAPLPPRLLSFSPSRAYRATFNATVESRQLHAANGSQATVSLRRGNALITGSFTPPWGDRIGVEFTPDSSADTGWYDFEATFAPGGTYRIGNAVRIVGPELDEVYYAGLIQGQDRDLLTHIGGAAIPLMLPGQPDKVNLESVSICRNGYCVKAISHISQTDYWWRSSFSIPADAPPGAYDVVVRTLSPAAAFSKPASVIVAPSDYLNFIVSDVGYDTPYWALRADSLGLLMRFPTTSCGADAYRLKAAPAGMVFDNGILSWKPGPADTGWHEIRFSGKSISCFPGLYLTAYVAPNVVSSIRPDQPGRGSGGAFRARLRGSRLELELPETAAAELYSLDGRLLARLGRLESGRRLIAAPASARGEALLLCHLRTASGEAWLKVPRLP